VLDISVEIMRSHW